VNANIHVKFTFNDVDYEKAVGQKLLDLENKKQEEIN